jgi:hypothetical protein
VGCGATAWLSRVSYRHSPHGQLPGPTCLTERTGQLPHVRHTLAGVAKLTAGLPSQTSTAQRVPGLNDTLMVRPS